jgi:D-sedoheptulose 7-phosphate isomerase
MQKKNFNFINFFKTYTGLLNETQNLIDLKKIYKICEILEKSILTKKQIFVAGNGGSASVANHFFCDFNKGIKHSSEKKLMPKVISLVNSIELITAISNDSTYKKIFSYQLENLAEKNDCIILFSCSGNSKNIIETIKIARKHKLKIIFITGFLKKISNNVDIHLNLNCKNYGITEDIFSSIMHVISQFIRLKYSKKKEIL